MSTSIEVPAASADPILHADFIELGALFSNDKSSSFEGYARDIRISGTTDALTDPDIDEDPSDCGGEQSEAVAMDAWSEIERRADYCGGDGGHYPFEVEEAHITLKNKWQSSPYIFQLLLGQYGHEASTEPTDGARLFERLCTGAAREYLGGEDNGAMSRSFGFPRSERTGFRRALRELCMIIGEGEVKTSAPGMANQKDSHLDVVAWLPFCDGKSAQLIAFGQCATGKQWDGAKLCELVPTNFTKKWLATSFDVDPIRMFFIPRSVKNSKWRNTAIDGGIIFDRCRISWCAGKPNVELAEELAIWSGRVHAKHMRKQ